MSEAKGFDVGYHCGSKYYVGTSTMKRSSLKFSIFQDGYFFTCAVVKASCCFFLEWFEAKETL
jgi:hypothetical protein